MGAQADALARTILSGPFDAASIESRLGKIHAQSGQLGWAGVIARGVTSQFHDRLIPPRFPELRRFLDRFIAYLRALPSTHPDRLESLKIDCGQESSPQFLPLLPQYGDLRIPALATPTQLTRWLGLKHGQLTWLAGRYRDDGLPQFARYRVRLARGKSGKLRLLEIPSPLLFQAQRKISQEILNQVPVHFAAHGFLHGRSVKTYCEPHVGQAVVWKTDLCHFFLNIGRPRVYALYRLLGYPEDVADLLTGLSVHRLANHDIDILANMVSAETLEQMESMTKSDHLPQGAPSSPALSNLVAYRLDCRLQGLANTFRAHYTRYADDLAFSGDSRFKRHLQTFRIQALAVLQDEGFRIRSRKSKVMVKSRRQTIAGLVVNKKANVPRDDYKRLKATLFNCLTHRPESQNRADVPNFQAHLRGRIEHVLQHNRNRGEKLLKIFEQIKFS